MPRLVNRAPKYSLHKPTGQAIVRVNGRMIYLGKYGSPESHAKYDQEVAQWKVDSPVSAICTTTVSQLCLGYTRHAKVYYGETAEVDAIRVVLKRFRRRFGALLTANVRPKHVDATIATMAKDGLSRSYVNQALGRIKRMFRWGVTKDLVPGNVYVDIQACETLKAGRSSAKEPRIIDPVDDAIVDATLPHLPPVVADLVRVLRNCGARPSELFRMKRGDVDRSVNPWRYSPAQHKTSKRGKQRIVLFGPQAREVLLKYLVGPDDGLVFTMPNYDDGGFNRSRLHHWVTGAAKKAKQPHWHVYQLRHVAGTKARDEGGLDAAQVLLGHSSRVMTERYAKPNVALGEAAAERIG